MGTRQGEAKETRIWKGLRKESNKTKGAQRHKSTDARLINPELGRTVKQESKKRGNVLSVR